MTAAAQIEKRRPLTRAEFGQLMIDQEGRCACGCGEKLQPITEGVIDEHLEAVTLEARPEREDYLNPALRAQPPARPSTIAELHAAERLIDQQAAEIRRLKASEDAQPVARVSRKGNATGGLVWTDHGRASDLPDGAALFAAHLIEGRGEMKQEIYDNLCAADDQDIPLEDYPDRILSIVERYTHPAPDELRVAVEAFDPEDMRIVGDWIEAGEPKVSVPSGRIKALWQSARQALAALQAEQKGGA